MRDGDLHLGRVVETGVYFHECGENGWNLEPQNMIPDTSQTRARASLTV